MPADLDTIVCHLHELPAEDRVAYLDKNCANDAALRGRVEAKLAELEKADAFFAEEKAFQSPARREKEEEGSMIGPYKLLQHIGEGGFGTVWMAEQQQPVRRRVALKIIKAGMDTKEVVARFEHERQALAMMEHPNIARVFDAGAAESGRLYFVMELVKGVPITQFCDEERLPVKERLALFAEVCLAIHHAHQKGIIHRDIKPSNILVARLAETPVLKIIDFGIAKATQHPLTDKTLFTRFEQFIGTPAYMSPEQASAGVVDIDIRSDIYSLGILLYELLTGKPPFDAKSLLSAGYDEMRRIICEAEPPRPSTRISTAAGVERARLAAVHQLEPARLGVLVRGDLDWIVMRAIEKDRNRRYASATALVADIRHYLADEPVSATPPGAVYLFRKFARRHRLAFSVGAGIAASLVIGITASVWQAVRARKAEALALTSLTQLQEIAPVLAEQAQSLAEQGRFDTAIEKLDFAQKLRPDVTEYSLGLGDLLQCQLRLSEAAAQYRAVLHAHPGNPRAAASVRLCNELLAAAPNEEGALSYVSLWKLQLAIRQQYRPEAQRMPVVRRLEAENTRLLTPWLDSLRELPLPADKPLRDRLTVREEDGLLALDLSGTKVRDLSILRGVPIGRLTLTGTAVTDLRPLRDIPISILNLKLTQVMDLSALSAPVLSDSLRELSLADIPATDFSPLAACTGLKVLSAQRTALADLSVLRGCKLASLTLAETKVGDISVLAGMPLTFLRMESTAITDISALLKCPGLKNLVLPPEARNVSALRALTGLEKISYRTDSGRGPDQTAVKFWRNFTE